MSYGFEFFDDEGTPILEDNPVFHVSETIDLVPFGDLIDENTTRVNVMFAGIYVETGAFRPVLTLDRNFVSTNVNGTSLPLPEAGLITIQDTIFVQLRSGQYLRDFRESVLDFPDMPKMIIPYIIGNVDKARIMSPVPPASPPGGHGMQVFDSSGVKTFDSRAVNCGIAAAFVITKSQIDGILFNNNVVNLTLPKPMPNCWIGCGYFVPIFIDPTIPQYGDYYAARIHQTSSTNIRIDRMYLGEYFMGANPTYSFSHDVIIYVARDF